MKLELLSSIEIAMVTFNPWANAREKTKFLSVKLERKIESIFLSINPSTQMNSIIETVLLSTPNMF